MGPFTWSNLALTPCDCHPSVTPKNKAFHYPFTRVGPSYPREHPPVGGFEGVVCAAPPCYAIIRPRPRGSLWLTHAAFVVGIAGVGLAERRRLTYIDAATAVCASPVVSSSSQPLLQHLHTCILQLIQVKLVDCQQVVCLILHTAYRPTCKTLVHLT